MLPLLHAYSDPLKSRIKVEAAEVRVGHYVCSSGSARGLLVQATRP
jgi:hypothetical protein